MNTLFNLLLPILESFSFAPGDGRYYAIGMACIGAGLAVLTGLGPAIGEGLIGAKAMEAIGRQPEAAGTIRLTMLIGQAVAETTGLYGLIIAFVLAGKVPTL
jgi:F-type H+-transporting ATPase subunit c